MNNLLLSLVGSFLNRVRGGLFKWLPANKIFYPIFLSLIGYPDWRLCLSIFVGAFTGQQICGWGKYISALTVAKLNREEIEVYSIDEICNKYFLNRPRIYGFVALSLRGLIWTSGIGLAINTLWYILIGLLMPVAYTIPTLLLLKTKHNEDKTAWNLGEWIWGFIMTFFLVFTK